MVGSKNVAGCGVLAHVQTLFQMIREILLFLSVFHWQATIMGPVSIVILLHLFQNINTSDLVIRAGQYSNIVSFMFLCYVFSFLLASQECFNEKVCNSVNISVNIPGKMYAFIMLALIYHFRSYLRKSAASSVFFSSPMLFVLL